MFARAARQFLEVGRANVAVLLLVMSDSEDVGVGRANAIEEAIFGPPTPDQGAQRMFYIARPLFVGLYIARCLCVCVFIFVVFKVGSAAAAELKVEL